MLQSATLECTYHNTILCQCGMSHDTYLSAYFGSRCEQSICKAKKLEALFQCNVPHIRVDIPSVVEVTLLGLAKEHGLLILIIVCVLRQHEFGPN